MEKDNYLGFHWQHEKLFDGKVVLASREYGEKFTKPFLCIKRLLEYYPNYFDTDMRYEIWDFMEYMRQHLWGEI
jgi:hypothetical protein